MKKLIIYKPYEFSMQVKSCVRCELVDNSGTVEIRSYTTGRILFIISKDIAEFI